MTTTNELLEQWMHRIAQNFRDFEECEVVVFNEPREDAVVRWVIKCLGNNVDNEDTAAVLGAILARREKKRNEPEYAPLESHIETIICPGCENVQRAEVVHTQPWFSYVHVCDNCEYIIMESEWDRVEEVVPA